MNARQLEILQHALGVDEYGRIPKGHSDYYRNHFCAGGKDEDTCRELVEMGYMQQHPTTEHLPYFNCSVTEAGIAAMRAESPKPPKLTAGQRRYQEWLDVRDCYGDMTFGQWLKTKRSEVQP